MQPLVFTSLRVKRSAARGCRNPGVSPAPLVLTLWTFSEVPDPGTKGARESISEQNLWQHFRDTVTSKGLLVAITLPGSAHVHHLWCWLPLLIRTQQRTTGSPGSWILLAFSK